MILRLVKHGVPWDVAWKMSPTRRLAYVVAFGEIDGGRFDWSTKTWSDPNQP
jgi:hypothetical protein